MIVNLNKQYFSSNKRKHKSFLSSQHLLSLHFSFLPSEKIFVFSFICMDSPYQTSPKKNLKKEKKSESAATIHKKILLLQK